MYIEDLQTFLKFMSKFRFELQLRYILVLEKLFFRYGWWIWWFWALGRMNSRKFSAHVLKFKRWENQGHSSKTGAGTFKKQKKNGLLILIFSLLTFSMSELLPGCAFPSVYIVGSLTSKLPSKIEVKIDRLYSLCPCFVRNALWQWNQLYFSKVCNLVPALLSSLCLQAKNLWTHADD